MKKALLTLAPGFEEIETVTVVDILRRAGARVTLAGTVKGLIEGSRGVHISPDCLLDDVKDEDFDLIILPGGQPGTDNLKNDRRIVELLKKMDAAKKQIAAICAAPMVLHSAGLLHHKMITSHPSVKSEMNGTQYSEARVVVDGNIITSRGPGTAMEFAMKLVEVLFDTDRVHTVNKGVMAKI
ncbi:MAG: DJ-1 family glyoxalase III [Nitrospinaceae bacterium]